MFRVRPILTAFTACTLAAGVLAPATAQAAVKRAKSRVVAQNSKGVYQFPKRTTRWKGPSPAVFRPCFEVLDCTIVETPMNHADPFSPALELSVVRRRAADPARRIGVLFVNPGGPGASANGLIRAAERIFPAEIVARFDIVGLDPRGTTNSAPVSCGIDPLDEAAITNDAELLKTVAAACGKRSGQLLKYIDTESSARDHDWVRRALGKPTVSFLGFSYGGYLGAMYAQLFPTTLRAVILDSGLDHTLFGTGLLEGGYAANERSLIAFLTQCQDGTFTPCAFNNGTDLVARYDQLLAYYGASRSRENRRSRFEGTVERLLESQSNGGWKILADGLAAAAAAGVDKDPHDSFDLRSFVPRADYEVLESIFAYQCHDGLVTQNPDELRTLINRLPAAAPHFQVNARGTANLYQICAHWPAKTKPQPVIKPNGIAPILLVGATLDLITPIEWQQSMVATTGGTLLTRVGSDHGQVGRGTCVDPYAVDFLVNLVLPAPGVVCTG
jgi:pimeloyl-ACP methyl ester carboxylesterase